MMPPFVPITLALIAGLLGAAWLPAWPAGALGLVASLAAVSRRLPSRAALPALLLAWMCLGVVRMAVWNAHPVNTLAAQMPEAPEPIALHSVIRDDPADLQDGGEEPAQALLLDVRHVRGPDGWRAAAGRLRATVDGYRAVRYGDEVLVEGEWVLVPLPGNPGQYDKRAALARQGIQGLLDVRPFDSFVVQHPAQGHGWLAAVFRLRHRWETLIDQAFPQRQAGLLRSLLLGQRVALDERTKTAFVETGTIHLLVISGFNVGLIAVLLELLLRVAGVPWRIRAAISAACLGGYAVLTGLQPPVLRAALMAWVVLGAGLLDRVISWPNTLAAAALAIILVQPTQLFDPGFQLSFGAVLSLLIFVPRWSSLLDAWLRPCRPASLRRYLALTLSATAAVWVGLAPVLAWYFYLLSPVSMLANVLLTPLISALVGLGTLLLAAGSWYEPVVAWGRGPLTLLLNMTVHTVEWCHRIPGGCWYVGQPPPAVIAAYYALLLGSMLAARRGIRPGRIACYWAAASVIGVWSLAAVRFAEGRWLTLEALDVGHGDCLLLTTPAGRRLMIDAGSQEAGRYRVLPALRAKGIGRLDALILTHTDEDHIGGAIPLLEHLRIGALLTNGVEGDTMSAHRVHRLAAAQGLRAVPLSSGMRLSGEPEVAIEVLHPPPGLLPGVAAKSNDNSLVIKVTKGSVALLLTGDIEEAGLPRLLEAKEALRADVLKVPHHGSRLGDIGQRFFNRVGPKIALLSVGRLHRLPASQTLEALRRTGAAVYSTRDHGALRVRTDGESMDVHTFR